MKIIHTAKLDFEDLTAEEALWVYNGLDCAVTGDVEKELLNNDTTASLISENFVLALQAPAMEMMLRGIKVDKNRRNEVIKDHEKKIEQILSLINCYAEAIWDKPLNPNSPKQKKEILYEVMKLPLQYSFSGGKKRITTDRAALEKLQSIPRAKPLCKALNCVAELGKKLGALRSVVDPDGRMRCSYNICGTETARWSSSKNAFGTGTNLQNQTNEVRDIYVPDEGKKFAYVDLDQAESRVVAYISEDENYISACESGDLHSTVCEMVWADLAWGTAEPREIAEQKFYRHFSYRDMAKRAGHGTNYYGKPRTMAKFLKIDEEIVEEFQHKYFNAFPGIKKWHQTTASTLQLTQALTTCLGRTRHFFGRPADDTTLREAIAYEPQSVVGELLNLALWRVWRESHWGSLKEIEILAQVHDAILIQYPEEIEDSIIPKVINTMEIAVPIHGKTMTIPVSAEVGWNWRKYSKENLSGIKSYDGKDERQKPTTEVARLLAGRFPRTHKKSSFT